MKSARAKKPSVEQLYLSDSQVAARYGVARTTIWRWVRLDAYPAPRKIAPGCTRWSLRSIEAWEQER